LHSIKRRELPSSLQQKTKGAYILATMVMPLSPRVFSFQYQEFEVLTVLMLSFTLFRLSQRRTEERSPSTSFKVILFLLPFLFAFYDLDPILVTKKETHERYFVIFQVFGCLALVVALDN
jgi:hypothetical protein